MKKSIIILTVAAVFTACGGRNADTAAGYFEAEEITISAEVNGRVTAFAINEGDVVDKGQVLGSTDATDSGLGSSYLIRIVSDFVSQGAVQS